MVLCRDDWWKSFCFAVRYKHLFLGIYRRNGVIPILCWGMQEDIKSRSLLVLLVLGAAIFSCPATLLGRLTKSCLHSLSNVKTHVGMRERRGGDIASLYMASFDVTETVCLCISSRVEKQAYPQSPAMGLMSQTGPPKVPLIMSRKPLEGPTVNLQETKCKWSSFLIHIQIGMQMCMYSIQLQNSMPTHDSIYSHDKLQ